MNGSFRSSSRNRTSQKLLRIRVFIFWVKVAYKIMLLLIKKKEEILCFTCKETAQIGWFLLGFFFYILFSFRSIVKGDHSVQVLYIFSAIFALSKGFGLKFL